MLKSAAPQYVEVFQLNMGDLFIQNHSMFSKLREVGWREYHWILNPTWTQYAWTTPDVVHNLNCCEKLLTVI